jgi:glycosyltransferase involved in cell wall biosynthesis
MSRPDLISLVITTYNRSDALCAVLRSLADQSDKNFEIIVADDGSTVAHQAVIKACVVQLGLAVRHVWHPDIGFTPARVRNLGVAAASGDYLVLLDGDCVVETDFIRQHRLLAQQGCFVNGSRVLLSEGLTREVLTGRTLVHGRRVAFWLSQRLRGQASKLTGLLRLPQWVRKIQPAFVWKRIRSCNMGVWRTDYALINGFDESFVGWGHEDADFVLRLHNNGIKRKNGYCATEVYHLWHPQAQRQAESINAVVVRQRMASQQKQPTIGYRECLGATDVVVHRWG